MDREDAIEAIARRARAGRPRSSRGLWIAAIVLGVACAIGFLVILFADGQPTPTRPTARPTGDGLGFSTGLAIGLAIGIAIGYLAARRAARDRG